MKPTPKAPEPELRKVIRCAIYTRKSSEEGLDLTFNSLDAQRESAEAYIKSQAAEGWVMIPTRYDDGGFTGGNMDRPGLEALLADIKEDKVDCVVVYKVDRLSRSLIDFARIVEIFERHKVSFVSVTQHFNTTHSMGRLTLNILLSFAQFEREIIGERIRDKIAAQRQKGLWSGGRPILGYDVDRTSPSPKLIVNEEEAERVREIFDLYLRLGSLLPVVEELRARDWRNKTWTTKQKRVCGNEYFSRCSLYNLLISPIYLGLVKHKKSTYPGQHPAIVPEATFDEVQALLKHNGRVNVNDFRNKHNALLKRLLYCKHCQSAMTHVFAGQSAHRHRYYTCCKSIKNGRQSCSTPTLPAAEIERVIVDEVRTACTRPEIVKEVLAALAMAGQPVDPKLQSALMNFNAVWEALMPREQVQLIRLMVKRVEFDAATESVVVQFYGTDVASQSLEDAA